MLTDDYFKKKAEAIEEQIHEARVNSNWKITGEQVAFIIYMGIKEVAKDQRYSSIESINREFPGYDLVCKTIHNS